MKILLVGASGYIGQRLLLVLAEAGHHVVALVRSAQRLAVPEQIASSVEIIEGDLLDHESLKIPSNVDAAYYLVHSMNDQSTGFSDLEARCAENFISALERTRASQIIYLSGLSQGEAKSEHMLSRHRVEEILGREDIPLTVLRAGIIIGSGSASFEIMRDLVEKLPIMIAPKWVYSECQPISISDVLFYLTSVLHHPKCLSRTFEIGGPEVLTYHDMLMRFAHIRGLHRWIIPVPLLTPYLSSLWLVFVTSVNISLAKALIKSLISQAICKNTDITTILPHECLNFETSLRRAFEKIEQHAVVSSWKDAIVQSKLSPQLQSYVQVPQYGCLHNLSTGTYDISREQAVKRLWEIGGSNGWYAFNWAWVLRGWFDKMIGGVGLRRGRTHPSRLRSGDALDFWRVLVADRTNGYLLIYAEMKLPGEAWLEWKITGNEQQTTIQQSATFRPKGILGRLYWYCLYPIHILIFRKLCNAIGKQK